MSPGLAAPEGGGELGVVSPLDAREAWTRPLKPLTASVADSTIVGGGLTVIEVGRSFGGGRARDAVEESVGVEPAEHFPSPYASADWARYARSRQLTQDPLEQGLRIPDQYLLRQIQNPTQIRPDTT